MLLAAPKILPFTLSDTLFFDYALGLVVRLKAL
jgi:hypothetical protein